jgi:nucleotide-binding universal stress UspA family protein
MSRPVIVVGVDGSDGSLTALRWALREAALRHLAVEAVNGWLVPEALLPGAGMGGGAAMKASQESSQAALDDAVELVAREAPDVAFTALLVAKSPAEALIEQARDAELLVVGRRGHGGFLGALLGSVANQVAHHAHCPVVLMPAVAQHAGQATAA